MKYAKSLKYNVANRLILENAKITINRENYPLYRIQVQCTGHHIPADWPNCLKLISHGPLLQPTDLL